MKREWLLFAGIGLYLWWQNSTDGTGNTAAPDGEGGDITSTIYSNTVGAFQAMTNSQSVSQTGIALIQQHEGCRLTAYPDHNGYSIGWGHNGVPAGTTWTQDQADAALADDAVTACNGVLKNCSVSLGQNQLDALTDWYYNEGSKVDGCTLFRLLNAGSYDAVPDQLARWVYVTNNGQKVVDHALQQRRQDEIDLWNTPDGAE